MNERQAREQGLVFNGATASEWRKEEIEKLKTEAKEIRKLGFRAVVVHSGANEWGGGSYLLYTDNDYDDYQIAKGYTAYVNNEELYLKKAEEEYLKKVEEIKAEASRRREYIKSVEAKTEKKIL